MREWLSASPSELPPLRRKRAWYATLGTTVGICALLILMSNAFFSFTSPSDSQTFGQYPNLLAALRDDRHSLLTGDAFRSAVLIALAGGALWLAYRKKIDANKTIAILSLLVLIDLWAVDKRYLNNDNFSNRFAMEDPFAGSAAHLASQQLADDTSYFRVINLTVSPMQDASTSYYFHSVGGYHAAKLQRYQELWDRQIARGNFTILNMLNTKYFIGLSEDKRSVSVQENSLALGPAWVVDSLVWVPNADAEIAALDSLDLPRVAVVDEQFASTSAFTPFVRDSTHRYEVRLVSYQPNHLVYRTNLATPAPVVFSEIYYPDGWNAYIDGQPAEYFRANYVLRAMIAPQGEHTVEFRFEPREVIEGDRISLVCSLLLLGGTAGACWYTAAETARRPRNDSRAMKKVLVISYYFPPAGGPGVQRWLKFVKYLRDEGYEPVLYVPQGAAYPVTDESLAAEIPPGLTIHRGHIIEPSRFFPPGRRSVPGSSTPPAAKKAGNPA